MHRKGSYIVLAFLLCACLLGSCRRKDEARVIPRNVMAKIYAEMFVVDQWMVDNAGKHRMPDTTLYYEPVFNKYGYTTDDYLHSVDHYLSDPERFSRILDKSVRILKEKQAGIELESEQEITLNDEK